MPQNCCCISHNKECPNMLFCVQNSSKMSFFFFFLESKKKDLREKNTKYSHKFMYLIKRFIVQLVFGVFN